MRSNRAGDNYFIFFVFITKNKNSKNYFHYSMLTPIWPAPRVRYNDHLGIAQVSVYHALEYVQSGRLKVVLFGQHEPGSYEMVIQYQHRVLIAPASK